MIVEVAVRTGKGTIAMDEPQKKFAFTAERRGWRHVPYTRNLEFSDTVEYVQRAVRQHNGWQSIVYKGRRYQLHGGIRTCHFICLHGKGSKA